MTHYYIYITQLPPELNIIQEYNIKSGCQAILKGDCVVVIYLH